MYSANESTKYFDWQKLCEKYKLNHNLDLLPSDFSFRIISNLIMRHSLINSNFLLEDGKTIVARPRFMNNNFLFLEQQEKLQQYILSIENGKYIWVEYDLIR